MPPPSSTEDWIITDSWWGSFTQDQEIIFLPSHIRRIVDFESDETWQSVDNLWRTFEDDVEILFAEQYVRTLTDASKEEPWESMDDLWDSFADQQQAEVQKLQHLMGRLSEVWTDGQSSFDADPLTTDWRSESQYEGPLRTNVVEEGWSQWLAHLLRTSTGPFAHEFLDVPNRSPDSVRREVVVSNGETIRRVDIIVEYDESAASIEVKKGDSNYEKTPQTADLTERDDNRDWSHLLLLQKERVGNLIESFDDSSLPNEGDLVIQRCQYPEIEVRYWRDVSQWLRQMLLDGCESDSHWQASAYLFITLIEQRILKFEPFAFVGPDATTSLHRLVAAELEAQIAYLEAVLQDETNHE